MCHCSTKSGVTLKALIRILRFSGDFCQTQYFVTIKQSHSFTKKEEEENMPPEQIEADFFMGNFGCLQKKYGSPVQHNSHEVWTLKS